MADAVENYEKLLAANLVRITDWLKFSETKNGALLALASGWTVASTNVALRKEGIPTGYEWVLPLSIAFLLLAILRLIWSFMPKISTSDFLPKASRRYRGVNLLFYGDIAEVDLLEFPTELESRYMPASKDSFRAEYLADMAHQVQILSCIAHGKFKAFRTAGWLCFTGLVVLTLPSLLFIAGKLCHWWGF